MIHIHWDTYIHNYKLDSKPGDAAAASIKPINKVGSYGEQQEPEPDAEPEAND